jgi:hypothetical protein
VALTNWHQEITLLDTTLTVLERPVLHFAIDNCHKMLCMGLLCLHRWSTQGVTLRILLTLFLLIFFFRVALRPSEGQGLLMLEVSRSHTQWRTKVGRTPLDEWSARRRGLYLTTHNTHNWQTSIPLQDSNPQFRRRAAIDPRHRPHCNWDRPFLLTVDTKNVCVLLSPHAINCTSFNVILCLAQKQFCFWSCRAAA